MKGSHVKTRLKIAVVAGGVLAAALTAAPAQAQAAPVHATTAQNQSCPEAWVCAYDSNGYEFFSTNAQGYFPVDNYVSSVENLTGWSVGVDVYSCSDGFCSYLTLWFPPHSGDHNVGGYVDYVIIES
jgi:hypothetical protein